MKRTVKFARVGVCALFLAGCATSFTGSAHVENGRAGCEAKCQGQGMELVGMVYMGEYSDGCVCAAPGQTASMQRQLVASSGSVAAGAAGVVMQMRAQQQRQAQSSH